MDLPDTDIEADLLDSLEADRPGSLEEDLLDGVMAAHPGNALGPVSRLGIVDQDTQMSVVAESSHAPLRIVDEPLALRQNPFVPVHSGRRGDGGGVT